MSELRSWRFNPHPARRPGATLQGDHGVAQVHKVSILTRPEGRVQQAFDQALQTHNEKFQSSPGQKAGCNSRGRQAPDLPHPVSFLTRPEGRVQPGWSAGSSRTGNRCFNPHPARRPGATTAGHRRHQRLRGGFNPHPARRPGATPRPFFLPALDRVSILTRPEGRVQPGRWRQHLYGERRVSILTRPEGRVQPAVAAVPCRRRVHVSILTRPSGRVQPTWVEFARIPIYVSILTRPSGRVQPQAKLRQ